MYDVLIVGCGIVGAATAFELSKYRLSVAVAEKENDVACGATKANSAILHAGYDPRPGTLMARLNVRGSALAEKLARALAVPYRKTGSLVLALSEEELPMLERLYAQGMENGVPGLRLLSREETLAREPALSHEVRGALFAPSAAIVSPWEFCLALAETAVRNGVSLHRSCEVTGIEKKPEGGFAVHTSDGTFEARFLVNAAGVHAAEIQALAGEREFQILPSRGEYCLLDKSQGRLVQSVVFQCPTRNGKGVLVAPTTGGNLIVGPTAALVDNGENTATTAEGLRQVRETALRSAPGIRFGETIRTFAGVRALSDQEDFIIGESKSAGGLLNLAGIKSPGLSSAPAIAELAAEKLREMVQKSGAHSTDLQSPESAEHLCAKCDAYARNWKPVADELWENSGRNPKNISQGQNR